jgi:hypothetical protein
MLLTPEQLAQLRKIIQDASTALAISTTGYKVTDAEVQRLVDEGYLQPDATADLVFTAFEHGALTARLAEARSMSWPEFHEHVRANPFELSEVEERARDLAQARAGTLCVGLGNRWSTGMDRVIINADQELAEKMRETIQDTTASAIQRRRSLGSLRSDFRQITKDWSRDWDRIAHTEVHQAHQDAFMESTLERQGPEAMMAKIPDPDACDTCKGLYLDPDGKPLIKPASWWAEQGATNFGRKKKDWKPVTGTAHPWCRCELQRVPEFMEYEVVVDKEGRRHYSLVVEPDPDDLEAGPAAKHKPLAKGMSKARKLHGEFDFRGLSIAIENRKGSVRHWYDPEADRHGKTKMIHPYGYIRRTEGVDGDHYDCYVGPDKDAPNVYVVHQRKAPDFINYDEDKAMLGFQTRTEAMAGYLAHYDSRKFIGEVTTLPFEEFKRKVLETAKDPFKMVKARTRGRKPGPGQGGFDFGAPNAGKTSKPAGVSNARPKASNARPKGQGPRLTVSHGGPYIGPRGGLWADPQHKIPYKKPENKTWHNLVGEHGAPKPGERGYKGPVQRHPSALDGRTPVEVASTMLDLASQIWEDQDMWQAWSALHPERTPYSEGGGDLYDPENEDHRLDWPGMVQPEELPDMIGVPHHDQEGREYTLNDRLDILDRMVEIAAETIPEQARGDLGITLPGRRDRKGREKPEWSAEDFRSEDGHVPVWAATAILADSLDRGAGRKLRLCNVGKKEADAFIQSHHAKLPYLNPRGLMYSIGAKRGDRLVAVATAGTPSGGWDPEVGASVLEVTRVASDGTTMGAATKLVSRLIDLVEHSDRSGGKHPPRLVTYSLTDEEGTTYAALKDKGMRPTGLTGAGGYYGARAKASGESLGAEKKVVWEAGPGAGPAKWGLLTRGSGKTVTLISCGKKKAENPSAAKDLYQGAPTQMARRWAERHSDEWHILSAEHGLVDPQEVLEPYSTTLDRSTPKAERKAWNRRVLADLRDQVGPGDRVVILAGDFYTEDFPRELEKLGVTVELPLKGMGTGDRKGWLSRQLKATEHADPKVMAAHVARWGLTPPARETWDTEEGREHALSLWRAQGLPAEKVEALERKLIALSADTDRDLVAKDGTWRKLSSTSTVFVNAAGGSERLQFTRPEVGDRNVGAQITAASIPKTDDGMARYVTAGQGGQQVMVDSGEYTAHKKGLKLDFDQVFDNYERLLDAMPRGTVQVAAPDKILDPVETGKLRAQYAHRVQDMVDKGAKVITPLQGEDAAGLAREYMQITRLWGTEGIVLGFPTVKKWGANIPMTEVLPFLVQLYTSGQFPKAHWLGLGEPARGANRNVQVVAAAYFAKQGVDRERIMELVATPDAAQAALDKVKTGASQSSLYADAMLADRFRSWLRDMGADPDQVDPADDDWIDFMADNPEEFDTGEMDDDKEAYIRRMTGELTQADTSGLSTIARWSRPHDPHTGKQVPNDPVLAAKTKAERYSPVLDHFLVALGVAGERRTSNRGSEWEALAAEGTAPKPVISKAVQTTGPIQGAQWTGIGGDSDAASGSWLAHDSEKDKLKNTGRRPLDHIKDAQGFMDWLEEQMGDTERKPPRLVVKVDNWDRAQLGALSRPIPSLLGAWEALHGEENHRGTEVNRERMEQKMKDQTRGQVTGRETMRYKPQDNPDG